MSLSTQPPMRLADPRAVAFCSRAEPDVFHAVAYRNDVWKEDPFDVETIHEEARALFQGLVHRATTSRGATGRILLLQGEAGSGKTHLMRAFRNWTHSGRRGYFGYMQMTSATNHYGRYILNNLIDSLDQPYDESAGETTGLMRISTALAESPRNVAFDRLEEIRTGTLDSACLAKLVDALADQIVLDDRFDTIDFDLIRALLYLQTDDARIRSRILKYLRCEGLSDNDRRALGGIVPRTYNDADPERLIERLGALMAALESVPLVLCVDQLEDIYNLEDSAVRFRRALAALCDVVSRTPTAVVVISCLEDFYKVLSNGIAKSLTDRVEKDPAPLVLKGLREEGEIVAILSRRLRFLYAALDAPFREDDPTFPFTYANVRSLGGMRARDVLEHCREHRERCQAAGQIVEFKPGEVVTPPLLHSTDLIQAWNDHRTVFQEDIPAEDEGQAALLARSIAACSDEVETAQRFEVEVHGRMVPVECHAPDNSVDLLLVGVCNKLAQGGGLGRQVDEVVKQAGEHTPVIVRSTELPLWPKTAIAQQLGALVKRGGRRVVVGDSDWRTMLAFPSFRDQWKNDPEFAAWLKQEQPLSRLRSLRSILGLDDRNSPQPPAKTDPAPETPPESRNGTDAARPEPIADEPIVGGTSNDRAREPVLLLPSELKRHAAFLGGTGSGKTTVALNVIEQLLLRGIPAILVDRKGDLCGYAKAESWVRPLSDPALSERRERLRERVEVAVYTPGNPQGRPLSIAIVPPGLGTLGSFERGQMAKYATSALAGMMNYSAKGGDSSRKAILAQAIDLLAQTEPDGAVTLETLIEYIAEQDPALINAVGRLDVKLFEKLVQDLETLRLTRGEFLASRGEPLDPEALLGLGRHASPGKTRLSIISTKFLGASQEVQFWVSQLLIALARWASRSPSDRLQAVVLFDEADLYLPALRQPPSKEPMEDLLKRARSAGLGLMLATQSPGDFDYKSRDNIRAWFVGRIQQPTALAKLKPMLSECRGDIAAKLPTQETGEFHLIREGAVTSLRADRSVIDTVQLPEEEILALARQTRGASK